MKACPWEDSNGQSIYEGDVIEHPSGERGVVEIHSQHKRDEDRWRVRYEDEAVSRLCLQIGDKGMAVKAPRLRTAGHRSES